MALNGLEEPLKKNVPGGLILVLEQNNAITR
jgi:hypothetical protein